MQSMQSMVAPLYADRQGKVGQGSMYVVEERRSGDEKDSSLPSPRVYSNLHGAG